MHDRWVVYGGELKSLDHAPLHVVDHEIFKLTSIEFVGVFKDKVSARDAWKARAQGTVDNALMRFFIVGFWSGEKSPPDRKDIGYRPHQQIATMALLGGHKGPIPNIDLALAPHRF